MFDLAIHNDYSGSDCLTIGNGQVLPINQIVHSYLHTPTEFSHLKRAIYFSFITANLILVQDFSKDTCCIFIYSICGFILQDWKPTWMLLKEYSKGGQYPHLINDPFKFNSPKAFIGDKSLPTRYSQLGHPSSIIICIFSPTYNSRALSIFPFSHRVNYRGCN